MLHNLTVVLVKTRFPENVGMAARACANMGARDIVLVDPERWSDDAGDPAKAVPLATPKGQDILAGVRVVATLAEAVADCAVVFGTTARTGGWRRELLSPERAAAEACPVLAGGDRVAVVFGPEDRGLTNDEIEHCHRLLTIPTAPEASSLNLAQAVLVVLYECLKGTAAHPFRPGPGPDSRLATHAELERLHDTLRDTLLAIDYLRADNPDYFMMPVRRFLGRTRLRRHEFDLVMGVCRQVKRVAALAATVTDAPAGKKSPPDDTEPT